MSNLLHWLEQGGPAIIILLALSVAALSIIIAKGWEFYELRIGRRAFVAPALDAWQQGATWDALKALKGEKNPLARVMASAIQLCAAAAPLPEVERRELATQFAAERLEAARTMLRPLEVIATLSPLLGLFGTVLGMIEAFQQLKTGGGGGDAAALSGGIAEALLSTAGGLAVAIPATAALHAFERIVERLHKDMESALTRIFVRPPTAWNGAPKRAAAAPAPMPAAEPLVDTAE